MSLGRMYGFAVEARRERLFAAFGPQHADLLGVLRADETSLGVHGEAGGLLGVLDERRHLSVHIELDDSAVARRDEAAVGQPDAGIGAAQTERDNLDFGPAFTTPEILASLCRWQAAERLPAPVRRHARHHHHVHPHVLGVPDAPARAPATPCSTSSR